MADINAGSAEESVADMLQRLFPRAASDPRLKTLVSDLDNEFVMTREDLVYALTADDTELKERVESVFQKCPRMIQTKVWADLGIGAAVAAEPTPPASNEPAEVLAPTADQTKEVALEKAQTPSEEDAAGSVPRAAKKEEVARGGAERKAAQAAGAGAKREEAAAQGGKQGKQTSEGKPGLPSIPSSPPARTPAPAMAAPAPPAAGGAEGPAAGATGRGEAGEAGKKRKKVQGEGGKKAEPEKKAEERKTEVGALRYVQLMGLGEDEEFLTALDDWRAKEAILAGALVKQVEMAGEIAKMDSTIAALKKLLKMWEEREVWEKKLKASTNKAPVLEKIAKYKGFIVATAAGIPNVSPEDHQGVQTRFKMEQAMRLAKAEEDAVQKADMNVLLLTVEDADVALCSILKRAYKVKALTQHPDKMRGGATDAHIQEWREMQRAHIVLTDPPKRREYVDMMDHNGWVRMDAERARGNDVMMPEITAGPNKQISSGLPNRCSLPRVEHEKLAADRATLTLSWLCKNKKMMEVMHYEVEVRGVPSEEGEEPRCEVCADSKYDLVLAGGDYVVRVRALNMLGAGEWSQSLDLAVSARAAEERGRRPQEDEAARKARRERAVQEAQEEARANLAQKMSSYARRQPLAADNLVDALSLAKAVGLPLHPADTQLLARANASLLELRSVQDDKASLKAWKTQISPFPQAALLAEVQSSDLTAAVANQMYQFLSNNAREALKAKLSGDLERSFQVAAAVAAGWRRSDVFRPQMCQELRELGERLDTRLGNEKRRREAEEKKREKQLEEQRKALQEEARLYQEKQRAEEAAREEEWRQVEEERRRRAEEKAAAAAAAPTFFAMPPPAQPTFSMPADLPPKDPTAPQAGVTWSPLATPQPQHPFHAPQLPFHAPHGAQGGQGGAARGGASVERSEWMLEKDEVAALLGPGGKRFLDLQARFPDLQMRLEGKEEARANGERALLLQAPTEERLCALMLLASHYMNQPRSWEPSQWCACGKCTEPERGCIARGGAAAAAAAAGGKGRRGGESSQMRGREEEEEGLCSICMERRVDTTLEPCGHALCRECTKLVRQSAVLTGQSAQHGPRGCCPFCRSPVASYGPLRSAPALAGGPAKAKVKPKAGQGQGKELCRHVAAGRTCPVGAKCHFSHSMPAQGAAVAEAKPVKTNMWKTKMCKSVASGEKCAKGAKCSFAHSEKELRG